MAAEPAPELTVLVLLEGSAGSELVEALRRLSPEGRVQALLPPVTGSAFLQAQGRLQAELDTWWERSAPAPGRPLVVLRHAAELPAGLAGLDADFVVAAIPPSELARYEGLPGVRTSQTDDPTGLAELALTRLRRDGPVPASSLPDPFELLAAAGPLPADAGAAPPLRISMSRGDPLTGRRSAQTILPLGQLFERLQQLRRPVPGPELGQAILARKPLVAAVVSRKGGVGKTASAAAIAALLGEAVDGFGHTAALVDANVGNPDAWGRLELRGHPATVREIVGRLARGEEPPSPVYAETPALAVYPESREAGDGYAPAQVQRLAGYLKARHAAVVVDLPNRLPSFSSPEAALAATWIAESAVVVLPTTADPAALVGVTEYLAAASLRNKAVVVPYIVPRLKELRTAPEVLRLLDTVRAAGATVVEVPDDDRATLALIRRTAITEVGLSLRQAYLALAAAVVEAASQAVGT